MLNITPSYLNESVKSTTGFTVSFWIQQTIMTEAKRLLYATDDSVKEIAYRLGFDDHAYFNRYFSKAEGKTPLQCRMDYRK
ncbi:AraC-like DNA-binding protein [Chryseobacterium ginsenosidimutans]|uniref:helix-turn-helix domain-containing protein n=1 Tax=Chryseobacterium ginsenosidimutans TaxID=687846 RepID=UPI0027840160|nr:helix-turn-helix domain-containing protein [Chryseobacterium ginsenosidimutans]MDQ0595042.1 AraC-like DNA-binding protein [Chryseobacterium ginsenosidimutans]